MSKNTHAEIDAQNKLVRFANNSALDVIATIMGGLPTSILNQKMREWYEYRLLKGREILLDQLKHAEVTNFDAISQDDLFWVIYEYMKAAEGCTATKNLEILARLITDLSHKGKLNGQAFKEYKNKFIDLTFDQVRVLGVYAKHWRTVAETSLDTQWSPKWQMDTNKLARDLAMTEVSEKFGIDELKFKVTVSELTKNGFFLYQSGYGYSDFEATPVLYEFFELLNGVELEERR